MLFGGAIRAKSTPMNELDLHMPSVAVTGKVFAAEVRETRRAGLWVLRFDMTDYAGSVTVHRTLSREEAEQLSRKIEVGQWLTVQGRMEQTRDGKDIQLNPRTIVLTDHEEREDRAEVKRVELHLHTKMSAMDALTDTKAAVERAIRWGHPAIAITDHGGVQSFPDAWHAAKDKIKILYGMEGYLLNNIDDRIAVHGAPRGALEGEIVCFDLETTGLKSDRETIIEIGAVVLRDGEIGERFQTFVAPGRHLTPEIVALTGITDETLKGAPSLGEALRDFLTFVNGRPLAAHNADFDIGFLREGCRREGLAFSPDYIDSLVLAQNLLPELGKHKLDVVAEHLDLPAFRHHRASDDAAMVGYMLIEFWKMLRARGVETLEAIN
ncbi:MAG: PHP domain-containing protein, partial [Oscillibacter sp.]|nr:PHP domain-containing protein [Oscillibacter sp.]